jgi:Ca2+-binding RTX toxin-like protein
MRGTRIVGIALVAMATGAAAPAAQAGVIVGTPRADRIVATPAADIIYAGSGDDTINDVGNGDVVYAGSGRDTIQTLPIVRVSGIVVDGNVGNDTIRSAGGKIDDATLAGGSGDDKIVLRGCRNHVRGGSGNDSYENLELCPTPDPGTVEMGNGADTVNTFMATRISGGNGDDSVRTRFPGSVFAGSGNDFVRFDLGGSADVHLGAGADKLDLSSSTANKVFGNSGHDHVYGRPSNSFIDTQSGDDLIELAHHAKGNALDGGGNRDVARIDSTNTGTTCKAIERVLGPDGNPRKC